MCSDPRAKLVLAGAALLLAGGAALGCGGPSSVRLPGPIHQGVVHDGKLYAVTAQGNLVAVDLAGETARDLGNFGLKLSSWVAVVGRSVCVASADRIHVIDPAAGKLLRSLECGQPIHHFGALDAGRIYVQGARSFAVLDVATGKTVCAVTKAANGQPLAVQAAALDDSGKRVRVLLGRPKIGIGTLDLETGKLTEMKTALPGSRFDRLIDGTVAGSRVYFSDGALSYGVWMNHFGYVDLKTLTYHALPVPDRTLTLVGAVPGPDGSVYLMGPGKLFRYDAAGKLVTIPSELPRQARLLAVWDGNAVAVAGSRVFVAPLDVPTARAK